MLDRLVLLKRLLKAASEDFSFDDLDFDLPMYNPPKEEPKPPAPVVTKSIETPKPDVPVVPEKPVLPAPVIPTQPVVQPIPAPAPVTPKQPEKQIMPSWFDSGWKPIRKSKIKEDFSTSHWGAIEDEPDNIAPEPTKPEPKIESEPEVTMSPDDAIRYLESLPNESHLSEALVSINYTDEELRTNYRNKKLISTVLALAIAHLKGLIDHADTVFGKNKDKAVSASQILIDNFENEIKKLPQRFQERSAAELYKNIEGRKRGPLRELTSQWYGPALIFINNRSIRLIKSTEMSVDDAEKQAQEEWASITQLIDSLIENDEEKEELQKLGAQKLLAGGSLEDAKKLVTQHIEAIKEGIISTESISVEDDQLKKLFPNVKVDPNENWEEDRAQDMTDEEMVRSEIEDLPPEVIDRLAPAIVQFGQQALKFAKLSDAIERGIDEDKMVEADDALQMIYDNIESLARQIFVINPEYISRPLAHEKFEDVYVVFKSIRSEAKEQGLESIGDRTVSAAESASEGLSIDPASPGIKEIDPKFKKNPRLRRPNESEEDYKVRQTHEKELADASRHRYLQRLLTSGDAVGYLERKRQYRLAQRPKETSEEYRKRIAIENEMDRIRNPEYKKNKLELVKWRKLATLKTEDVPDMKNKIMHLLSSQENRTYDLYKRIEESWLPKSTLDEIENSLRERRIQSFQHEFDIINNLSGMNSDVLKSMEYVIREIPRYFDEAKIRAHSEKVSYSYVSLDMASVFLKQASSL